MKKYTPYLMLVIAILIAILTHFYQLGNFPSGLNADEAGQGYSAYSIVKTGADEFGKSFPILFRSSGDFKTPVYTYLLVPLIPILGLSPFTVRFPSAFFAVLTLPVVFLLIKELIPRKLSAKYNLLPSVATVILAISPWHILFGRTAYECNVALFIFVAGCLLFYWSLRKPWLLVLSAIVFAISIPAYHSERIITPLMILILFTRHKEKLLSKTHLWYLVLGGIVAFIILLPTYLVARTPGFFARVDDLNIMSVGKSSGYVENYRGIFSPIVNSKILLGSKEFIFLYLSYFSPRFIFSLGDSGPRSSFPELSTFFLWQLPFYIWGIYLLIKKKELEELRFFTIATLSIAPIPAAFTRDPYSTTRSLQMVIPLIVVISIALFEGWQNLKKFRIIHIFCLLLFSCLIIYSLLKLYSSAVILNEYYRGKDWEYGWEQTSNTIKTLNPNLPVIVDSSRNVAYIELAFFLKADPLQYQRDNFEVSPDEYYTNINTNSTKKIGGITWRPIIWEKDLLTHQYLIGDILALSDQQIREHNLKLIREIKYTNGGVAIRIVETGYFPANK